MSPGAKSLLDKVRENTNVVVDTASFEVIKKFRPNDVATDSSLLFNAATSAEYVNLVKEAVNYAMKHEKGNNQAACAMDKLFVLCGKKILGMIPGRLSMQTDPRLSFDTQGQVQKAIRIIEMYEEEGISKDRVLIKLASTWEGIKAAEILERDHGIHCNMTLMFNMAQAVACADAKITSIMPFAGRIYDWFVKNGARNSFKMHEDPGVKNVTRIYNYYKQHGYETLIMGASFRKIDQVTSLSGCDALTIGASLLNKLAENFSDDVQVEMNIGKNTPKFLKQKPTRLMHETTFRWEMNEDIIATDLLAQGVRQFACDAAKLEEILAEKIQQIS